MRFVQKRRLERREVVLNDDGIEFSIRAPGERTSFTVPYESVMRDPVEFSLDKRRTPVFAGISFGLGLIAVVSATAGRDRGDILLSLVVGAILIAIAAADRFLQYFPKCQMLQLSDSQAALIVFADEPNRKVVTDFVAELKERTNQYLLENYGTAAPGESRVGQLERLARLLEQGTICEDEFEALKAELMRELKPPDSDHGQYL